MSRLPPLCVLFPVLVPGLCAGENWSQLKLGMTVAETRTALGSPILRSAGQGFEIWIYDHGAEAVMYGSLIGWTTPAGGNGPAAPGDSAISAAIAARSTDIWSVADRSGEPPLTFLALLPQPAESAAASPKPATLANPTARREDAWVPRYLQGRR